MMTRGVPAWSRFMALVWRKVCGLTRCTVTGCVSRALATYLVRMYRIPDRDRRLPCRLQKRPRRAFGTIETMLRHIVPY